jgi:RecA-family ATPase
VFRDSVTGDLPFLIEGVWPEGATAFIGAEPKAGKTWLALAIAVSLRKDVISIPRRLRQAAP